MHDDDDRSAGRGSRRYRSPEHDDAVARDERETVMPPYNPANESPATDRHIFIHTPVDNGTAPKKLQDIFIHAAVNEGITPEKVQQIPKRQDEQRDADEKPRIFLSHHSADDASEMERLTETLDFFRQLGVNRQEALERADREALVGGKFALLRRLAFIDREWVEDAVEMALASVARGGFDSASLEHVAWGWVARLLVRGVIRLWNRYVLRKQLPPKKKAEMTRTTEETEVERRRRGA